MRASWIWVMAGLASCAATSPGGAEKADPRNGSRLSFYLGERALDEGDYDPVDKQGMLGLEFSQERPGSSVGWELGLMVSGAEESVGIFDVQGATAEAYGGVRKSFGSGSVHPILGAGLSAIAAAIDVSGAGDDDDSSLAGYVHGGVGFDLSETITAGLDLRVLLGSDLEIAGVSTDADYGQIALFFGFNL